jgi:hypothetical protein
MPQPLKLMNASLDKETRQSPDTTGLAGSRMRASRRKATAPESVVDKPVALTVKVDQARYESLKVLGARTRRSNQEILLAALDAYLRNPSGDDISNVRPAGGHLDELP